VEQGYAWVLTLDQDSVPSPNLVAGLVDAFHACEFRNRIGAIGSNWVNATTSTVNLGASRFRGRTWREWKTVINSGTLFSLSAYARAGPFREDFFIDSVDHEYCLRLRANGYRVIVTRAALMVHPLGDYRHVRLFGLGIAHSDHPPVRKYFQMRNRLVLLSEYALQEPLWAAGQARRMIQDSVLMLCCERSRRRKIAAVALGARHFLRGRMGPLSATDLQRLNS
jgi:rhamnosyltransferase